MRVEPHTVDSIVHVVKRGTRGMPIVRDEHDQSRFPRLLYYLNDDYRDEYWERSIFGLEPFTRPEHWPDRSPLVKILAWTLMSNHLHLVLKEMREGGLAKFTQKIFGSMTTHFNAKYGEKGSLFQGSYKGRTVDLHGDEYLRYLAVYVMVKNPFELYPGGFEHAIKHFDEAYTWAAQYPFSSLSAYARDVSSPIVDKDIFGELFESADDFKEFSKECIENRFERMKDIQFGQV